MSQADAREGSAGVRSGGESLITIVVAPRAQIVPMTAGLYQMRTNFRGDSFQMTELRKVRAFADDSQNWERVRSFDVTGTSGKVTVAANSDLVLVLEPR